MNSTTDAANEGHPIELKILFYAAFVVSLPLTLLGMYELRRWPLLQGFIVRGKNPFNFAFILSDLFRPRIQFRGSAWKGKLGQTVVENNQ